MANVESRADWAVHLPAGVNAADLDLTEDGSLPARWLRHWSEDPRPQLRDVDGRWWATDRLEQQSRRVAGQLRGAGLEPGDRVVLSAETSAAQVVAYIGLLRAGLVVVPINTTYREPEVAQIVADARPRAALVDNRIRGGWISAATKCEVLVSSVAIDLPESAHELGERTPDEVALLIYTSGTTGRPKGVGLTHGNLLAGSRAVELSWRWQPDDDLLLTLPLFHLHGLGVGFNGTLSAGARVTLRPGFETEDVRERLSSGAHSLFFGVPAMYQRLAEAGALGALGGLRLTVSGSAPLPRELAEHIAAVVGELPLERYGMSETMMLTSNPYLGERQPGSVGWPLPGVELRVNKEGEVEVRGPNVIDGYWEQPEATARAFTRDGWFRTGDVGHRDDDGRLTLIGRNKDLIITGGYNVYPREIEEALLENPGVREVAVVGLPSERWGEAVTAFVVCDETLTAEDLLNFSRSRLAPYKLPKEIRFLDSLPRNVMGKVVTGELR